MSRWEACEQAAATFSPGDAPFDRPQGWRPLLSRLDPLSVATHSHLSRIQSTTHFLVNSTSGGAPLVFHFGDEEEQQLADPLTPFWDQMKVTLEEAEHMDAAMEQQIWAPSAWTRMNGRSGTSG